MERKIELTFNGTTALIESDSEGFFNLNDIWRAFGLPDSKRPRSWRDDTRRVLSQGTKLYSVNTGKVSKTLADEDALYAYAMWVSPEFALVVIAAFRNLVQGNIDAAVEETVKVARDPLAQLLRDHYNPNRPHRHWMKVAKQYLMDDPEEGMKKIFDAYSAAQLNASAKNNFFLSLRKIVEGLIKDSGDMLFMTRLVEVDKLILL